MKTGWRILNLKTKARLHNRVRTENQRVMFITFKKHNFAKPQWLECNYRYSIESFTSMPIQDLHVKNFTNANFKNEPLYQNGCWVQMLVYGFVPEDNQEQTEPDTIKVKAMRGYFLIDSGSHGGAIRGDIVDLLKLPFVSGKKSWGIAGEVLVDELPNMLATIEDLGLGLTLQNVTIIRGKALELWKKRHTEEQYFGIVGRDVLSSCRLVYEGVAGGATLEYDPANDESA
jgi:hypothetical protein